MKSRIIGVDCGSVSVSAVLLDKNGNILSTYYKMHYGEVRQTLNDALNSLYDDTVKNVAVTSSSSGFFRNASVYDDRIALIRGVKKTHHECRSIIYVGGEKFGLIEFDENGGYRKSKTNTSCAAGTGSFLDQQSKRLSLKGIEEFCEIAASNKGSIPKIASRCAVFAKTDIIHAQQEGYSLSEICDGLCMGLSKNVADVICKGDRILSPVVFAGGVSKNHAVVRHLSSLLGVDFIIDDMSVLYGAYGSAVLALEEGVSDNNIKIEEILTEAAAGKSNNSYEKLELKLSTHPDFSSEEKYMYTPVAVSSSIPVEVDIYKNIKNTACETYLGIDIGSTSTKAALVSTDGEVLAGFYTRTSGRPLDAIKCIFETIDSIAEKKHLKINILSAGTTGSGRKFIGKIIGADCIVDEITAHARAAYDLNPRVDTIIEIGGQDAKFTTVRDGMVNFSVMNSVCAAGTGSFIEEQAARLGCPLSELSARAEGKKAPMVSDRCTVFMERDINHILSSGYDLDEALAAVLHSVRDNYLSKVAVSGAIGTNICFQGATAKNRMLIAAFEQKLGLPIFVSEFCHITGALGVALIMKDDSLKKTSFRGLSIYKNEITLKREVCSLCNNNCKITVADVEGDSVAYGFLCGRDYDSDAFVDKNKSGFDLLKARKKISHMPAVKHGEVSVGLPAALHMTEELYLWKSFFSRLNIKAVSSENFKDAVNIGKNYAGAEFCSPMSAMHGHVLHLMDECDYVFFPVYMEGREALKGKKRQYCYYTQYAPVLAANLKHLKPGKAKFVSPVINRSMNIFSITVLLYKTLKEIKPEVSFYDIYSAYEYAKEKNSEYRNKMLEIYKNNSSGDDLKVVFLGRPYTILSPSMNKGIPEIFANLGVKTFYQDMISSSDIDTSEIKEMLSSFHWNYAAKILETAYIVSKTPGLYPVFVTSFKCSPDSTAIDFFKRIMDAQDKPYLILQLDDHDSNVGYETRIEAALRSFGNHHSGKAFISLKRKMPLAQKISKKLNGKTLLIPNWDSISCRFIAATLVREGIDARLLEEDSDIIKRSMRHNTGQCIPMNVIAQEVIEYIEKHRLHPDHTMLWMLDSEISCNIKLYPYYIKSLFEAHGKGFEKIDVYVGEITFTDIGPTVSLNMYFAYLFGGIIRKLACRIRPYETVKGETDRVVQECTQIVYGAIISGTDNEQTAAAIYKHFSKIKTKSGERPTVAIFGDIYSRDNDIMNNGLVKIIEDAGGEVLVTSYTEYLRMIASPYLRKWFSEGRYANALTCEAILAIVNRIDRKYYKIFEPLLKREYPEFNTPAEELLKPYNISINHSGESLENILKVSSVIDHHPDVSLFIQASPAFCCPSLITEAMSRDIERETGVPVVSIIYDGTGTDVNSVVIPYIKFPRKKINPVRVANE